MLDGADLGDGGLGSVSLIAVVGVSVEIVPSEGER